MSSIQNQCGLAACKRYQTITKFLIIIIIIMHYNTSVPSLYSSFILFSKARTSACDKRTSSGTVGVASSWHDGTTLEAAVVVVVGGGGLSRDRVVVGGGSSRDRSAPVT